MDVVVDPVWDNRLLRLIAIERNFSSGSQLQYGLLLFDGPGTGSGSGHQFGMVPSKLSSFLPVYVHLLLRGFAVEPFRHISRSGVTVGSFPEGDCKALPSDLCDSF